MNVMEQFFRKARAALCLTVTALLTTLSPHTANADSVTYLDAAGVPQTANATRLTKMMLTGLSKTNPLEGGWYYMTDTFSVNNNIPIRSVLSNNSAPVDVHIILTNNSELRINGLIYKHWDYDSGALWIHAQTTDTLLMGKLTVDNSAGVTVIDSIEEDGYMYYETVADCDIQADSVMICGGNINVIGPGSSSKAESVGGIWSTEGDVSIYNAKYTATGTVYGVNSSRNTLASDSRIKVSDCVIGILNQCGSTSIDESTVDIDRSSVALLCYSNNLYDSVRIADSDVRLSGSNGMISDSNIIIRNSTVYAHATGGSYAIGATGGKLVIEDSNVNASCNNTTLCVNCAGCSITNSDIDISGAYIGLISTGGDLNISDTNGGISGDYSGILCSEKVSITNGYAEIEGGTYGISASDSIILDWTTDRTTHIYASTYTCPTGKLIFRNCFGLLSTSAVATAQNANDEVLRAAFPLSITSAGVATYYEGTYDMLLPDVLTAKIATYQTNGNDATLEYTAIADGELVEAATDSIPAGVAVLLFRNDGLNESATYALIYCAGNSGTDYPQNLLHGSDVDTLLVGNNIYFRLSVDNNTVGWYDLSNDQIPISYAHKAWLELTQNQSNSLSADDLIICSFDAEAKAARPLIFDEENRTTGVDFIQVDYDAGKDWWYDLSGRKYDVKPTKPGIYIYRGKKVIIR